MPVVLSLPSRSHSSLLARPLSQAALFSAMLLIAPLFVYPVFIMKVLCMALFACAFNLLVGHAGLLSFGHAMFFGVGGYASAHAAKVWGMSPEASLLFAISCAFVLSIPAGIVAIRRQGIQFAMSTLALSQLVFFVCLQSPLTGGEDGIQAVPRGRLLGIIDLSNTMGMYFLVAGVFLVGFFLILRIMNSPFGEVLRAIRDHEPRATSLGFDTTHYKLIAFVLSGAIAGLAGGLKALVFQLASLTDVHWTMSGEVILIALVGGLGTRYGPVIGALVIVAMQEWLAGVGQWVMVVQGVIFVLCVLICREGIVGILDARRRQKISETV